VADSTNNTLAVAVVATEGARVGPIVGSSISGKLGVGEGHSLDVGVFDGRSEGTQEGSFDGAVVMMVVIAVGAKVGMVVGGVVGVEVDHSVDVGVMDGRAEGVHEGTSDGVGERPEGAGDGAKVGDRTHRSRAGTFRSPAPSIPL